MERMTPDTTDFNSLSKKQLVELVIAKYNDCFRLEEGNRKLKDEVEVWKNANKILRMHDAKMEYENKELKKEREMLIEDLSSDKELQQQIAQKQVDYYRENQKLKEELSKYKKQYEHSMGFSDFSGYDDNFNS